MDTKVISLNKLDKKYASSKDQSCLGIRVYYFADKVL